MVQVSEADITCLHFFYAGSYFCKQMENLNKTVYVKIKIQLSSSMAPYKRQMKEFSKWWPRHFVDINTNN